MKEEIEQMIGTVLASVGANQAVDLFKSSRENIGAIFSNNYLLVPRLKSEIKAFGRAKALLIENNISPRSLNLKLLAPLIENSVLEDENELSELWSHLIANYLDKEKHYNSVVYINILKELTTEEAKLLLEFNNRKKITFADIHTLFPEITIINILNLERLRLLDEPTGVWFDGGGADDEPIDLNDETVFPFRELHYHANFYRVISPLGKAFLKAVTNV